MGYFGVSFVYMSIDNIWKFFSAMHFVPLIIVYLGYIVVVKMGYFTKRRGKGSNTPDGVKTLEKVQVDKKTV